jgi:RimJ/RimL family protein N-acetyltransferase
LRIGHATEMVDVLADPALYEFTGGKPPSEADLVVRYTRQTARASEGWLNWVVRNEGAAVGTVQVTLSDDAAELAWVISTSAQGKGFATEASAAVVEWLRENGVTEFQAHIHPGHEASMAVARRLGFSPTESIKAGEVRWELR